MMEDRPPLTSPDGSSNGNPLDRCPCPLYSRDSTQEHQEIPQENRVDGMNLDFFLSGSRIINFMALLHFKRENPVKVEVKEEETYVMGDDPCKEEILPEISPDTRETRRDIKAEEEENVKIEEEEGTPEISPDLRVTQRNVKAEAEEEKHMKAKGKAVLEIGMDGQYTLQNVKKNPTFSSGKIGGDDITAYVSREKAFMPNHQAVSLKEKKRFVCSECGKCFTHKQTLIVHQRSHTGEKPFLCSECGKGFSYNSHLTEHKRTHPEVDPFSCSECGRRFRTWRILVMHQRVHLSKNVYPCSNCGQGFFKMANLKKHERLHRRLKLY